MRLAVKSRSEAETRQVGRRLAGLLRAGDIVLLCGELGAGKTAFVGGIGDGLGVEEPVTSPSFILVNRYDSGFLPLVHADVYRLASMSEFEDLGAFEDAASGVLVVEWGEAVEPRVPDDHLRIEITVEEDETRTIGFIASPTWESRPLEELQT